MTTDTTENVTAEVQSFLQLHPEVETVEAILPDINGILRGKWIPRDKLINAFSGNLKMPMTVVTLDAWGRDNAELVFARGDEDGICQPDIKTLTMTPWQRRPSAQFIMSMGTVSNKKYLSDPRQVLQQIVERFNTAELKPVVAIELEFCLFYSQQDESLQSHVPVHSCESVPGEEPLGGSTYCLDSLDVFNEMLHEIRDICEQQALPLDTISKEAGPSQYELNLHHIDDPLLAADQAIMLKRVIKAVAKKHGLIASFMAKPFGHLPGNGMHVHCSVLDQAGKNIFDNGSELGSDALSHAVAGVLASMPDTVALLAPNINSYRRFQPDAHAPLSQTWGYENRTVALRIPAGNCNARRIEHRIAGADANPYLAMAALLAGVLDGLEKKMPAPNPVAGNSADAEAPKLPVDWRQALINFDDSKFIAEWFGEDFKRKYSLIKWQEIETFHQQVTALEYLTYLQQA